ncbi:hypothetical protein CRE_23095 [Caenorhabditis remanei]|uniref:Sdz-33 F-box domain-containing protein n=1 Tax=Caenorhabditis remanei TaxID=31234 RepID=E3N9G6_CAERE|nr:hypothetical protein CRE_23095 [Caenorhabditis remanei]
MFYSFRFVISLVSTKTKNLVSSLGIETEIHFTVSSSITVRVYFGDDSMDLDFYQHDQNRPVNFILPTATLCDYEKRTMQLTIPFNFTTWKTHIQTVFRCNQPVIVHFRRGAETFDIQSLKQAIGYIDEILVNERLNDGCSRQVLRWFADTKNLFLDRSPFETPLEIQQIFMQNYDKLVYCGLFSVDDMLILNSERTELTHPKTQKDFNRFIKNWIGGSNTRINFVSLLIHKTGFDVENTYLDGIRCMVVNEATEKEIREEHEFPDGVDMNQIRREDGTTAVVVAEHLMTVLHVHFIIL